MNALRREIARHDFLYVIDEASSERSLAVVDRREGLGVAIENLPSLRFLLEHGADSWLESGYNISDRLAAN